MKITDLIILSIIIIIVLIILTFALDGTIKKSITIFFVTTGFLFNIFYLAGKLYEGISNIKTIELIFLPGVIAYLLFIFIFVYIPNLPIFNRIDEKEKSCKDIIKIIR
jgi:predicted permease